MLYKNKKGQFLIVSALFLFLIVIFIYSIETHNSYIVKTSEFNLLDNIIYETCQIAKLSNGSNIDNRLSGFVGNVSLYCSDLNIVCNLNIINNSAIPPLGNWSMLNYTHYNYSIEYQNLDFSYSGDFNC